MNFRYTARDPEGRTREGSLPAANAAEVARKLREEGLFAVAIAPDASDSPSLGGRPGGGGRVKRSDVIAWTNQLAVMVEAGVPLATSLRSLATQSATPALANVVTALADKVEGGAPFSESLAAYPRLFDKTYLNLVRASEVSGSLGEILDRLSTQMQGEQETRQKVLGALIYPGAMLLMCLSTSTFLIAFVFPKIKPMFATRKLALPLPTKLLMGASDSLTQYWPYYLIGLAALVGAVVYLRRREWAVRSLDWSTLRFPLFGTMFRKVALARSLRTLATTVNAGVPMLEALRLSGNTAGNVLVRERLAGGRRPGQRGQADSPGPRRPRPLPADAAANDRQRRIDGPARPSPAARGRSLRPRSRPRDQKLHQPHRADHGFPHGRGHRNDRPGDAAADLQTQQPRRLEQAV